MRNVGEIGTLFMLREHATTCMIACEPSKYESEIAQIVDILYIRIQI